MKKLFKFLLFSIITLSIFAATLDYQYHDFLRTPLTTDPHVSAEGTVFVIPMGTPVYKIANNLVEAGILKSSHMFLLSVYANDSWHKLKAGEYLIKPGSTPVDLITQLRDGKVIQYALTIVPGWTFERLMLEIAGSPKIQHALIGLSSAEIMAKLGHATEHPEGQFFPETYYYPAGTTDIAILQRSYRDLQAKLSLLWNTKKTDSILKSAYDALILASIIEKESSVVDEYRDIAGVYTRRLAKNMPLQADPTVIYGAGKTNITREMLTHENPYNTYLKAGLPPTPIALASAKALEAALDPKAGETLYFVAKPDGKGHVFTENLSDHNSAVAEYRKGLVNTTLNSTNNTKSTP
ncbi:MAG TPA: endolytic transglycosylase MltG [Gammaproteobacteria bacterium]|nr:endolytic transglycosylase MltG [Gammaproteobacteria bacterium]